MIRRLGSSCMQRLAALPASYAAGLPGAAGAWPASLQSLSALAATISGSARAALHTSVQVQQDFISLNTLSDNPGATKTVRTSLTLTSSCETVYLPTASVHLIACMKGGSK